MQDYRYVLRLQREIRDNEFIGGFYAGRSKDGKVKLVDTLGEAKKYRYAGTPRLTAAHLYSKYDVFLVDIKTGQTRGKLCCKTWWETSRGNLFDD